MRDIDDYSKEYLLQNDFELDYQVKYRRKKVLELLKNYPHNKILEIGCGMESVAKFFDDYAEYTIVEPSKQFIQNAAKDVPKARFFHGLLEDVLPDMKKFSYDYVLISSLLHEVEKPSEFLHDVHQLCGTNTIIHINVPNAKSFHRLLAYESGLIDSISAFSENNIRYQQHSVFDIVSLKGLIEDTLKYEDGGVVFIDEGSYFIKPFTHHQMEKCLNAKIFDAKVIEGFNRMIKYLPDYGSEIYVNYRIIQ